MFETFVISWEYFIICVYEDIDACRLNIDDKRGLNGIQMDQFLNLIIFGMWFSLIFW